MNGYIAFFSYILQIQIFFKPTGKNYPLRYAKRPERGDESAVNMNIFAFYLFITNSNYYYLRTVYKHTLCCSQDNQKNNKWLMGVG